MKLCVILGAVGTEVYKVPISYYNITTTNKSLKTNIEKRFFELMLIPIMECRQRIVKRVETSVCYANIITFMWTDIALTEGQEMSTESE
jgi:hypothetical protein